MSAPASSSKRPPSRPVSAGREDGLERCDVGRELRREIPPAPDRAVIDFLSDARVARCRRIAPALMKAQARILEGQSDVRKQASRLRFVVRHEPLVLQHVRREPELALVVREERFG